MAFNGALTGAVIFVNLFELTSWLSFERKSPVFQHLLGHVLLKVFETFRESHWIGLYA